MPALKAGRSMGEPRPMVTTMYTASISLAVGLTGSFSADDVHSSAPAAGGLGFVRIESGRAAEKALPPLASISIASLPTYLKE
jgi:hypothetical protein